MSDQPEISNLVRETRQCLLTQGEFAAKLGVSNQSVNRWENGRTLASAASPQANSVATQTRSERSQDLLVKHFADEG